MKINPENFVVDEKLCLNFKSFFISGNDESYIISLLDILIKNFSKRGYLKKNINKNDRPSPDLFQNEGGNIYVCDKYIGNKLVEEVEEEGGVFIFYEKSSTKNKPIKQFYSQSKERALIECFELDQSKKKTILSAFIKKNELGIDKNTYWFLLDLLDNRFPIFYKELEKLVLLEKPNDTDQLSSALNSDRLTDISKFFFKIHLSRADIVSFINSSINSISDFYSCFAYFKIYSFLLFSSENNNDLQKKIPKYLFREKQTILDMFGLLTNNKKKALSALLYKTESLIRKNPGLYKSLFFRFVLNYKKTIS